MVRNKPRRTKKAGWSEEYLKQAIQLVNEGQSKKSVGRQFGIPRSTLRDRLKSGKTEKPKMGRKPVFIEEQEKILESHVLEFSKIFHGITIPQLKELAYNVAEKMKIKHNFNKISKKAGDDWVASFRKRNPRISLRTPEPTSINRITAFNKAEVELFYKNLEDLMGKYNFEPRNIYNVDESGISTVQKPAKILAGKGQKQVGGVTSWERGKNITVICAMSASGGYIPPLFVHPRARMSPLLERGGPAGSIYRCSKNGWSNDELFFEWLEHFNKHAHPSADQPVLLIMDNHDSHVSLKIYEYCRVNYIHVVTIPPHTSHRLQPLDISFFGPLKNEINKESDRFMRLNVQKKITPYDIAGIFKNAYIVVAAAAKAISGFEKPGIYPLVPNKINGFDFIPVEEVPPPVVHDIEIGENNTNSRLDDVAPTDNYCDTEMKNNVFKDVLNVLSTVPALTVSSEDTRKRKGHSIILTTTPMKKVLEEKQKKRDDKLTKGKINALMQEKRNKTKSEKKKKKTRPRKWNSLHRVKAKWTHKVFLQGSQKWKSQWVKTNPLMIMSIALFVANHLQTQNVKKNGFVAICAKTGHTFYAPTTKTNMSMYATFAID